MQISITNATLYKPAFGQDIISFETQLPPTTHPWTEPATLTMLAARDTGLEYLEKNFPDLEVVCIRPDTLVVIGTAKQIREGTAPAVERAV